MSAGKLLNELPGRLRWSLVAAAAMLVFMLVINQPLHSEPAPQGIISLQFAGTADQSAAILNSWGERLLPWAVASLVFDYGFIAVYLAALVLLTSHLTRDRPGIREQTTARWVKTLFIVAALADVVENGLLLGNLRQPTDMLSLSATLCALIKFTGLVTGAAGLVIIRASRRHPLTPEDPEQAPHA